MLFVIIVMGMLFVFYLSTPMFVHVWCNGDLLKDVKATLQHEYNDATIIFLLLQHQS